MCTVNPILNLEALLRLPYVEPFGGFDLSADGATIAFAWNRSGQWEVYTLPLDGSAAPRQVTAGPGAKHAPRWSPDGSRLAYALDLDGGEAYDLCVWDGINGEHTNLTPDTPHALQPNFSWSPDGRWIAFLSDHAGHFDTYIVASSGGAARRVLALPNPDWRVVWSPDGRWLAVETETQGQDSGIFLVPAAGGEAMPITIAGRPLNARDACWSPDGARLAFTSDPHGQFDIGLYEPATGQITWLTQGQGDREAPAWSPDGARLACVHSDGPLTSLAVLNLTDGSMATHRVAPGVHYQPRFTPDGAGLIFAFDNPAHPCDLWRLDLNSGVFRQLTHSLPQDFAGAPFALPEPIHYPSLDGQPVPALLYRPPDAKGPTPAVVYVHGGPNWLSQVTWEPVVQHLLSRGWAVLAPNYRGSTGYGRAWQLANRFDLGGGDTQDVVAGADHLARKGITQPDRIAVTGRSWGGYLTMTCLTQYPDRWAGGSAVVPFVNWFTAHTNSREDLQHWDRENFGHPEKDYALWRERSPFFFLDRITAPVQLICGAHDIRCPASESLQTRDRLLELGKSCDLALYPDEGHSFLKTGNVIDAEKRRVAFLAAVLEE